MRVGCFKIIAICVLFLVGAPAPASARIPTCFGKTATILGTENDDQLEGTSSRDVIVGLAGDDEMRGFSGDDLICGNVGRDHAWGDEGSDRLGTGRARDYLDGGAGPDVVRGGIDNDQVQDSDGNHIYDQENRHAPEFPEGYFSDRVLGGAGDDDIKSIYGLDDVDGGQGDDYCLADHRANQVRCETSYNFVALWNSPDEKRRPHCLSTPATLLGTEENDIIETGTEADVIHGLGGNDNITSFYDYYGPEKQDIVCGGQGDDLIWTGSAADQLAGGLGDDRLRGSLGPDVTYGGPGNDNGDDEGGADTYFLGAGRDLVWVFSNLDRVFAGPGADLIRDAGCGKTSLHGGKGNDFLDSFAYEGIPNPSECHDPDDVYGDEGQDEAEVDKDDNVYGVETINVGTPPPG